MKFMAWLAFTTFMTISALVSIRKEWFGFVYDVPGGDKFFHFVGMGLLSFFMVLGFSSLTTHGRQIGPTVSMTAVALLVTLDEIIQLVIPSRTFSLGDLAWSLAGVLVFGLAATGIEWIVHLRKQ
jgi:VanZ family protein